MKNYVAFIILLSLCVMPMVSQANILTDKLVEGVEQIIGKEVQKIEDKIDEFVVAEIKKIRNQLILAYAVVILISMAYSTVFIFFVKRYLSK